MRRSGSAPAESVQEGAKEKVECKLDSREARLVKAGARERGEAKSGPPVRRASRIAPA